MNLFMYVSPTELQSPEALAMRGKGLSLSPRERAGVRGKDAESTTKAPAFSENPAHLAFWRRGGFNVSFPLPLSLSPGERGTNPPIRQPFRASVFTLGGRRLSLSPRERAGVRGKGAQSTMEAPEFSGGEAHLAFWCLGGVRVKRFAQFMLKAL